jgi:hypothetical protein
VAIIEAAMVGRWATFVLGFLGACSSAPSGNATSGAGGSAGGGGDAGLPGLELVTFAHQTNRDVDILFVIDNSLGMSFRQVKLIQSFKSFTDTLESLPGGLPNVHLAIVSSDMGAGRYQASDIPACKHGGDQGVFQSAPRGSCVATGLLPGQRFISNIGGQRNYDADKTIADVFACLAPLGSGGCGFEHQLASALRALGADGAPAPPENAGFLRPNAYLSIILLTDEDDCSAPADSDLFDPASKYISDPLGPLSSFRCSEFGVLCSGSQPPRTMAATLQGCVSAEDGRLLRIGDAVAQLKTLKGDRHKVLAAAFTGPPMPYTVELVPPLVKDDPSQWPAIAPSCAGSDGTTPADPAVRIEQWVYAFGHNGVFEDICADDFAPGLQRIARSIGDVLGPPCLAGRIANTTGPHGDRPDCTIIDHTFDSGAMLIDTPLPSCVDSANVAPCWTLTSDASCPNGQLLGFMALPGMPETGVNSSVQCRVCSDPADSRCP